MTDTNPRDLIRRLADEFECWIVQAEWAQTVQGSVEDIERAHNLVDEARAYLAQSEPEVPTDNQLLECMLKAAASVPGGQCTGILDWDKEAIAAARAVLARWGSASIEPVPVSERLPGPADCDAEGRCWLGYPAFTHSLNGEHDTTSPEWDLEPLPNLKPDRSTLYWLPHWALPVPTDSVNPLITP